MLGDPVPDATSVFVEQIVGQVAGCTFREELFVDGAVLTTALAVSERGAESRSGNSLGESSCPSR